MERERVPWEYNSTGLALIQPSAFFQIQKSPTFPLPSTVKYWWRPEGQTYSHDW